MRYLLIPILIVAASAEVFAGAWGMLRGKNAAQVLIVVTDDTRSLKPEIIASQRDGDVSFPFEGACSFSIENTSKPPKEFSCWSTGKSPLAGATYRQTGASDKCNTTKYSCVAGCASPKVPKNLVYQQWECQLSSPGR